MTEHHLKTWPPVFEHVMTGKKTFEYRKNDRDFQNGDILVLEEWAPLRKEYTGRSVTVLVTYILNGGVFGVPEEFCVMSIKVLSTQPNFMNHKTEEA